MENEKWSIKDFEDMAIGKILEVAQENKWVVIWLSGVRIKFKNWK